MSYVVTKMDDYKIIQPEEKVKFGRGASGKYSYEITLLGKPEDNIERTKELKKEFDTLVDTNN